MRYVAWVLVIFLSACVNAPKRPVGKLKAINAKPTHSSTCTALIFNLETDFDNDLRLKQGHDGILVPVELEDLDRHWCMDAATKEDLTRFIRQWVNRYRMVYEQLKRCEAGE